MSAEDIVRAELDAWSSLDVDKIMTHFAREAVLDNPSHGPIAGYDQIRNTVEAAVSRTTHADMEIINLVATDNLVMTERVDRLIFDGKQVDAPVMGVFEVAGDKITAWRDYFDTTPHPEG
jgi:limonene-1,2-epoxide hydrolase